MTRTIDLPDDLAEALKQVAAQQHRSVNATLIVAATEYVERHNTRRQLDESTQKVIALNGELLERLAQ